MAASIDHAAFAIFTSPALGLLLSKGGNVILAHGALMKVRQKLYKLCCLGVKTTKVLYLAFTQVQNEGETETESTIRTGLQVIGVQQIPYFPIYF